MSVRDVLEQVHHPDHCIVVERNLGGVSTGTRKPLGPASIVHLTLQQVIDSIEDRFLKARTSGADEGFRQEVNFGVGRPVVDGGIALGALPAKVALLTTAQLPGAVIVLWPTTGLTLVGQHGFRETGILCGYTDPQGEESKQDSHHG